MPDTNCFRYGSYIIHNNEEQRKQYKEAAIHFFQKIYKEAENKKAKIIVSSEVIQELKVQSYTLKDKENKVIKNLVSSFDVEETEVPQEIEYLLREFSDYVRDEYSLLLATYSIKSDYLRTSDSRIFIHAYLNDATIATTNIKDFYLYPLFLGNADINVLYDILSETYTHLPTEVCKVLQEDSKFQMLLQKMRGLKY